MKFTLLTYITSLMIGACGEKEATVSLKPASESSMNGITGSPIDQAMLTDKQIRVRSASEVLVDFDDLFVGQEVAPDRYEDQGLRVHTGPSGIDGIVTGIASPCNPTSAIRTSPFEEVSHLFEFTSPVNSITLEVGDFGLSDADEITMTAFGNPDGTGFITSVTGFLEQGVPTYCIVLSLSAEVPIYSVEITSESYFDEEENVHSIFIDNLVFCQIDTDGDGCPDDSDPHPGGNDATIIIDGCDSGVLNIAISEDECSTMADVINDLADSAESHGAFMSALNALVNAWKDAGLITGAQKGAIKSCAAASDLP